MVKKKSLQKERALPCSMTNDIVAYADKCVLSCDSPSESACPIGVDVHSILRLVRARNFQKARDLLDAENPFPSLCARFCQMGCASSCGCAKGFRAVEMFLGDNFKPQIQKVKAGKQKVAVVGGGVAGLTAAAILKRNGVAVRVMEATESPGGLVVKATPEFRLPARIVQQEVGSLVLNLEIQTNTLGGAMFPIEEMAHKFDAVIIATGANKPAFLGIPGENLPNVFPATDYLSMQQKKGKDQTVVIGGNEMALDAARTARRLGNGVTLLFHKDLHCMPASEESIRQAQQEGIKFLFLTKPLRISGQGRGQSIECAQMMMAESDLDDTKVVVPIENSEFSIPCDRVIVALGLEPNPTMGKYTPLRTVGKGRVWTNQYMQTNAPNVFAAGEIATGSVSIEKTVSHAKECTKNVLAYLRGEIKEEE